MDTFEEEYNKILPMFMKLSNFVLLGNKIVIKGRENFIEKGPNIIVGNHIGTLKDAATFLKIAPRQLFPTSNKMIMNKDEFNFLIRKHLHRHLKNFGLFLDLIISPIKTVFINFISTTACRIGAIPVDLYSHKRMTIAKCQDYLKKGRAVVLLQGRGRIMKNNTNPYVSPFRKGPSIISYNLYKEEGIRVPVTPVATFGTHLPLVVPGKIRVNIGAPMFVTDYLADGFMETVNRFKEAMEARVKELFLETIKTEF